MGPCDKSEVHDSKDQMSDNQYICDVYPAIAEFFLQSEGADVRSIIALSMVDKSANVSVKRVFMRNIKQKAYVKMVRDVGVNTFTLMWNDLTISVTNKNNQLYVCTDIGLRTISIAQVELHGTGEWSVWDALKVKEGVSKSSVALGNKLMSLFVR